MSETTRSGAAVVRIRVLEHGRGLDLPARATFGSAGYDIRAAVDGPVVIEPGDRCLVPCGFCLAIPEGWEVQVRPRSGLAIRDGITLINSPGTIDSDYRGEVMVPLINHGREPFTVRRGERIAQMIFSRYEAPELCVVSDLDPTDRGAAGFGSTGRG